MGTVKTDVKQLDGYDFSTKFGFNSALIKLRYDRLERFYHGDSCLELGCADGEGTKKLIPHFSSIVAVDGSLRLLKLAEKELDLQKVKFIHSLFDDFSINESFDTVVLAHILEHVDDPIATLKVAVKHLNQGGVIIVDVPNALSLHRQAGVLMGLLDSEYQLNEADLSIGHQRVYDLETLRRDVQSAGLRVVEEGGIFMKPFSNSQMEMIFLSSGVEVQNAINAYGLLGERYPNISAEIFVVAKLEKTANLV